MTELLELAFEAASKLPAQEQDKLAEWILKELKSEELWDQAFAQSQDALAVLADEALLEDRSKLTHDLEPNKVALSSTQKEETWQP